MEVVLVALQRLPQQTPPGGGLGRLGAGGHEHPEGMQLRQLLRVVAAHVHEPEPLGPGKRFGPQLHPVAIHEAHRHPAVEVQSLARSEPLAPQLRQGVVDAGARHEANVVQLDLGPGDAAAQHHQEEGGGWPGFGG